MLIDKLFERRLIGLFSKVVHFSSWIFTKFTQSNLLRCKFSFLECNCRFISYETSVPSTRDYFKHMCICCHLTCSPRIFSKSLKNPLSHALCYLGGTCYLRWFFWLCSRVGRWLNEIIRDGKMETDTINSERSIVSRTQCLPARFWCW